MDEHNGKNPSHCVKCGTRHGDYALLRYCPHCGGFLKRCQVDDARTSELQCEDCSRRYVPIGNDFVERK